MRQLPQIVLFAPPFVVAVTCGFTSTTTFNWMNAEALLKYSTVVTVVCLIIIFGMGACQWNCLKRAHYQIIIVLFSDANLAKNKFEQKLASSFNYGVGRKANEFSTMLTLHSAFHIHCTFLLENEKLRFSGGLNAYIFR